MGSGPYAARHRNYQGSQRADADKSSSTLGVISGIVIGEAAVQAGFVSKVLIVWSASQRSRHFGAQLHRR
ncbi:spore germination protein [Bacillus licheniformis]|nr:spore germination protein [Bacillus licheniformis]